MTPVKHLILTSLCFSSIYGVNAGELLQRLAGAKVQQGCKQKGPDIGGLFACRGFF
jgi:hypothetical protein